MRGSGSRTFPALDADRSDDESKPVLVESVEGHVISAVWSPTGERLAAITTPTALIDDSYTSKSVVIVDASMDGFPVVSQFEAVGKLGQVGFSPDGERVAAVSAVDQHDPAAGRLMLVGSEGRFSDLLPELEGHVASFAWEDDEHLLYAASVGVWTTLGRVSTDGGRPKP